MRLVWVSVRGDQGQGEPVSSARYRLHCRIGTGILADSFQAERDDGSAVVVKLFRPGTADERYAREIAEVARRLLPFQAPGVCHVIDIGYAAGRLAVVRERQDDFNLGQVLSRMAKWGIIFPTPLALWVLCELLDAVRRAHAAGVIHGGIAPGNVLFGVNGQPSLCDFGSLPALSVSPELKARFVPVGRASYRSQEVERGESPTQRSDVFSLGAVAYQLLTLREVSPERPDPRACGAAPAIGSQLDQRLYPIVMRALEAIPQLRYPSCEEFAGALKDYLSANHLSPDRRQLAKLLLDLFPEGIGPPSDQERLPFEEPFLLELVQGIAPLQKSAEEPRAPRTPPPASASEPAPTWYAPPREPIGAAKPAAAVSAGAHTPIDLAPPQAPTRRRVQQQKALGFAGALLIVGTFFVALSIWRPGQGKNRSKPPDTPPPAAAERVELLPASTSSGASEAPLAAPASLQAASKPARREERVEWDDPPSRGAGYVSVSSDVPAVVYVDGRRVREPAPLTRYPVQAGTRKISVVAADTQERREFVVRLGRGQLRKVDSPFVTSARR